MTRVLKRRVEIVASLVIAGVLGALLYQFPGRAHADAAPAPALIPVQTALAARIDVPVYIDAIGAVPASKTATVTTRVDSQLQKVSFVEGSDVGAGDLLAQIDLKPYEALLAQAEAKKAQDRAQLENARRDVQRYLQLSPEDYTSQQTLDAARSQVAQLTAQLKADQAAIDAAKTQLTYTSITAPFSGRTGLRLVDEGNIVRASDTSGIVVITELQPITAIFTLPQNQLPDVLAAAAAGPVTAIALSSDGQELDRGTLTLIDNKIDPATDTVRLKATFANEQQRLWPGQFVNVRILMQTLHNVLTVPSDAVSQGPTGSFTYLVKGDGTVDMRSITVARDADGVAQISDWYTLFRSETLNALVREALANNPHLESARHGLVAAQAELRATAGSALPQVDLTAGASRSRINGSLLNEPADAFSTTLPNVPPHQRVRVVARSPPPGTSTAAGAVTGAVVGATVSSPWHAGRGTLIGALAGAAIGGIADAERTAEANLIEAQANANAEAAQTAAMEQKATDYRRAMTACLEGRGYSAR